MQIVILLNIKDTLTQLYQLRVIEHSTKNLVLLYSAPELNLASCKWSEINFFFHRRLREVQNAVRIVFR